MTETAASACVRAPPVFRLRLTTKVSSGSMTRSPLTATVKVAVVVPGANRPGRTRPCPVSGDLKSADGQPAAAAGLTSDADAALDTA